MKTFASIKHKLPFNHEAASFMDHDRFEVKWAQPNAIVVGYIADDELASNPLLERDGYGHIYNANRHSSRECHRGMQDALGLDAYWEPDLEPVDDHPLLRRRWIAAAAESVEFRSHCAKTSGANASLGDDAYYLRRAERFWRSGEGRTAYRYHIDTFCFTDEVKQRLWRELREARAVGNPDRVLLDCYRHSGETWSISGADMQCRFDTSNAVGVWVPDAGALHQLERLAKVYAFGLVDYNWWDGQCCYYATLDVNDVKSQYFEHRYQAFEWLEQQIKQRNLTLPRTKAEREAYIKQGRIRAAEQLARDALELYNQWLAGDTYGAVVATFQMNPCGQWELADEDSCWSYYGTKSAYEGMQQLFANVADGLRALIGPAVWQQTGNTFGYGL